MTHEQAAIAAIALRQPGPPLPHDLLGLRVDCTGGPLNLPPPARHTLIARRVPARR